VGFFFNEILVNPMLNVLVMLYSILFSNFGLSLIVFTVLVRMLMMPLQIRQTKQMKRMTELQPQMRDIQRRYEKDPRRKQQETMRLYREAGVNPIGCLGPFVIQLPIWIGLYQAILKSLGTNPDDLIGLSQRIYSWNPFADSIVPLNSSFLWLDLANPDPTGIILPILVGASTWAQQKVATPPNPDPRQAQTAQMMLWMFPIMLAFISLSFPSGLALYWVISNVIGVVIQVSMTRDVTPLIPGFIKSPPFRRAPVPEATPSQPVENIEPAKEIESDGTIDKVRKNRRRGNRSSPERARRKAGRSRNRNYKPR
jgi:YidC/Oxa1 family membrane protein insertase